MNKGKRFKFVPEAEKNRKGNPEDGQIRIEVQYEKERKPIVVYEDYVSPQSMIWAPATNSRDLILLPGTNSSLTTGSSTNLTGISIGTSAGDILSPGVTIEGSDSSQRFQKEETGEMEDKVETLTIELVGYFKTPPTLIKK